MSDYILIKKFKDLIIEIYGSHEEPMFKANDIGVLLGIIDIKSNYKGVY
jgi:hypothetical protein